jgi:hypothetical protein
MTKMLRAALLTLAVAATVSIGPGLVQAQIGPEQGVEFEKRTVIDFGDVTITGELTKPEGSYLMNRKRTSFSQLIRIRENFIPELLMSVDNL